MLVFAMILVWLFNFVIRDIKMRKGAEIQLVEKSNNEINTQFVKSEYRSSGVGIKRQISLIYESDIPNKRELIVDLLQKLHRYEDPGYFLEKNTQIQKYIFN